MPNESVRSVDLMNTNISCDVNKSPVRTATTHLVTENDSENDAADAVDEADDDINESSSQNYQTTANKKKNDEVEVILDRENDIDLDRLSIKYQKLQAKYERLEKEFSFLKRKNVELKNNFMRKLLIRSKCHDDVSVF